MTVAACNMKQRSIQNILYRGICSTQRQTNCVLPFSNILNVKCNRTENRRNILFQQTSRSFRTSSTLYKKKSFYDVLGVQSTASKEEIKSKYRELAKKCHPDLNRDDKNAEKKFREITEAYETLENDKQREIYDHYGHEGVEVRMLFVLCVYVFVCL